MCKICGERQVSVSGLFVAEVVDVDDADTGSVPAETGVSPADPGDSAAI